MVAIDSVAALTPKAELDGQIGDTTVGLQARLMSQAMRKLAGNLNRTNTVCVFTNQIREKIGVQFGSPETQPGGRALKFYASQRLDIRRIETLKEGTEAVGNRVRVKVVKNKVAAPFRQAEFDIEYGVGISREGGLLDFGIEHDLVQKSGSFFSYGETRLGQGRNNAKQFLSDNPELALEIETKIRAALGIDGEAPVEADPGARGPGGAGGLEPPPASRRAQPHRIGFPPHAWTTKRSSTSAGRPCRLGGAHQLRRAASEDLPGQSLPADDPLVRGPGRRRQHLRRPARAGRGTGQSRRGHPSQRGVRSGGQRRFRRQGARQGAEEAKAEPAKARVARSSWPLPKANSPTTRPA